MHRVENIRIRNFFWSVFSRIHVKYGKIWTRKNSVFGEFSSSNESVNKDILTG